MEMSRNGADVCDLQDTDYRKQGWNNPAVIIHPQDDVVTGIHLWVHVEERGYLWLGSERICIAVVEDREELARLRTALDHLLSIKQKHR
jgi:hypothetical protein